MFSLSRCRQWIAIGLVGLTLQAHVVLPFQGAVHRITKHGRNRRHTRTVPTIQDVSASTTTRLLVFDFFRERSQEGLDQLSRLANQAKRGQLGQGLAEAANYTRATNQAFADGLAKSRNRLLNQLELIVTGTDPTKVLSELEDVLLQADIGAQTAEEIIAEVQSLRDTSAKRLSKEDLKSIMRGKLLEALEIDRRFPRPIQFSSDPSTPTVLFIMGANGMGKTTTIGKLAHRLRTEGNQTVLLAACDTFRAGAVDQLQAWADRAGVDQVSPTMPGQKPSTVLFQALDKAVNEKYDTLLVDTSGRLSNNVPLTEELAKMKRIIQKRLSKSSDTTPDLSLPHETLLVLDAAQGRMALDSAKAWDDRIGLTGLILTKLDGSAKGGSVVAVSRDLGLPIKLIGVGEKIEDLRDVSTTKSIKHVFDSYTYA
jgi:fused signal recognition particle receptor